MTHQKTIIVPILFDGEHQLVPWPDHFRWQVAEVEVEMIGHQTFVLRPRRLEDAHLAKCSWPQVISDALSSCAKPHYVQPMEMDPHGPMWNTSRSLLTPSG